MIIPPTAPRGEGPYLQLTQVFPLSFLNWSKGAWVLNSDTPEMTLRIFVFS